MLFFFSMDSARVGIGVTAAAVASGTAVAVKRGSTRGIDRAVRRRIHPRRSPRVTAVAKGISFLAGPRVHPVAAAALGILLRVERGRGGYGPSAASVGSWGIVGPARVFIHQKRPPKAGRHHSLNRYGYPSGHTTAATAIGVAAAAAVAGDLPRPRQFVIWATVAAVSLAVGWSRLYLDEHWLDDVVGGWMAGTVIGLGAASLDESLS